MVIKGGRWGTLTVETLESRFWRKVSKGPGCWEWNAAKDEKGYGLIKVGGKRGRATKAHRVAWGLTNGVIPLSVHVLHHCDNRGCVNPSHLFLGTHQDNMRDMMAKGRCGVYKALITRKERHGY